jgi:uncharacterized coiled-coil protein SlyX
MTTTNGPTDDITLLTEDIIELTDIVEEAAAPQKGFEDFAMDTAVDARSLDQELDELLRDVEPAAKPDAGDDEIDLDILFAEAKEIPAETPAPARAKASAPEMDLSDLDDLFDSLRIGEPDEDRTALDIILDGDAPQTTAPAPRPAAAEPFGLDLDVPGIESRDADIQELTEEMTAEIPEAAIAQTAPEPPRTGADAVLPTPEDLDLDLTEPILELSPGMTPEKPSAPLETAAPAAEPAAPVMVPAAAAEELDARLAALETRIDELEARPIPTPDIRPDQIIAALPLSPDELPLTRTLREDILAAVDSKITGLASSAEVGELGLSFKALHERLGAMPDVSDAVASSPLAANVAGMEAGLADLATRTRLQDEALNDLRIALAEKDEAIALLRGSEGRMREELDALRGRVETLAAAQTAPEESPLAETVQGVEAELDGLRALVRSQEEVLAGLRDAMAEKDEALAMLRENEARLRQEVEALGSRMQAAPDLDALRSELRAHVEQIVPGTAARVIREEIQALMREMEG